MNRKLSPKKIMALCILQVIFTYIMVMDTTAKQYIVILSYKPLFIWGLACVFFVLGDVFTGFLHLCLKGKINTNIIILKIKNIKTKRLNILYVIVVIGLIITSLLIIVGAGGIPLLAIIAQSKSISEFNELQADSLPGIYGLHSLMIILMEYCIGLFILISIMSNKKNSKKIIIGSLIIVIATLLEGKRQGLAIFICFLGVMFISAKNLFQDSLNENYNNIIKKFKISAFISLLLFFSITYFRLSAVGYSEQTFFEPLRYLSLPLINLEYLVDSTSWIGYKFDFIKPLNYLLPAKIGIERGVSSINLPEPTSPSGYFAMVYLYWYGIYGVAFYSFCIGAFSEYMFLKALTSPAGLLFYGYLVWSVLMSHTYNHFMTITFIPMQLACYLLFDKYIISFSNRKKINESKKLINRTSEIM